MSLELDEALKYGSVYCCHDTAHWRSSIRSTFSHGASASVRPKSPYANSNSYIGRCSRNASMIAQERRSNTERMARRICSSDTAGTIGVHVHCKRGCPAYCVSDLYLHLWHEAGDDNDPRCVSRHVSSRTVNLPRILPRECPTVRCKSPIQVHDVLAPCPRCWIPREAEVVMGARPRRPNHCRAAIRGSPR